MAYKLTGRDISLLVITTTLWALSFPLIKLALDLNFPPIMLGAIRYFLAGLPLVIFLSLKKEFLEETKVLFRTYWKYILAVGIFMVTIPQIAQNIGMQYTTASLSTLIQSIGPIFAVILAVSFLNESLTKSKVIGTVIAIICTMLLVFNQGIDFGSMVIVGNILQVVTAISYALTGLFGKMAVDRISPIVLVGWSMFIGAIVLFPISFAVESQDWIYSMSFEAYAVMAILAVGPGLVATLLWYVVLRKQEVSRQILFIYLLPFFSLIFSYIILREVMSPFVILLGVITVLAVAIAQREK